METATSKKTHFSLVELMVCVAVLAIAASVTIPRYMTHVFQERQSECTAALREIHAAQQRYFREHGHYTADLRVLNWQPPAKPLYLYGFRDSREGLISSTLNPQALCPASQPSCYVTELMRGPTDESLVISDLPASHFDRTRGFIIGCVGNIDTDPALDRFSIDQTGQLAHVTNDLD